MFVLFFSPAVWQPAIEAVPQLNPTKSWLFFHAICSGMHYQTTLHAACRKAAIGAADSHNSGNITFGNFDPDTPDGLVHFVIAHLLRRSQVSRLGL